MRVSGSKQGPFRVPVAKVAKAGPETNPWFWHPGRAQGRVADERFVEELEKLDPKLAVSWNPVRSNWQVFTRAPQFRHPICQGWKLLFIHHDGAGGYLPLDNRLMARLYASDLQRWGGAKRYFDQVQSQIERDKEKGEAKDLQDTIDIAMESWQHSRIKNIGRGSKFSEYHA